MGKRLVIKDAIFTNYIDVEPVYQSITYTLEDLDLISSVKGFFGMPYTGYGVFGGVANKNQDGAFWPIDVKGAESIVVKDSYGQTSAVHGFFLDEDGNWLSDITGTANGYDSELNPSIPNGARWIFANACDSSDKHLQVVVTGHLQPLSLTEGSYTTVRESAFINSQNSITESSTVIFTSTRKVISVDLLGKDTVYILGAIGATGAQAFCLGVITDENDTKIDSIIGDTTPDNQMAFIVIKPANYTNARYLKLNVLTTKNPIIKYK